MVVNDDHKHQSPTVTNRKASLRLAARPKYIYPFEDDYQDDKDSDCNIQESDEDKHDEDLEKVGDDSDPIVLQKIPDYEYRYGIGVIRHQRWLHRTWVQSVQPVTSPGTGHTLYGCVGSPKD